LKRFAYIPDGFLYRDDWDESENEQLNMFRNNLFSKFNLREYYNGSEYQKKKMFEALNYRIRSVGIAGGQVYSDEEVIEEVIEMKR